MLAELAKKIFINSIRLYQIIISPLTGPSCRFYPSCSNYAVLAVEKHGALKGSLFTILRIVKCHPLHPGGADLP
jgi:uncharacterized protein